MFVVLLIETNLAALLCSRNVGRGQYGRAVFYAFLTLLGLVTLFALELRS